MITLYLDIDNVIANFYLAYKEAFKIRQHGTVSIRHECFKQFVQDDGFTYLPLMPNATKLIDAIQELESTYGINVEFLGSLANIDDGNLQSLCMQKSMWIRNLGLNWHINYVRHKGLKNRFATPSAVLVDDTSQNIYDFNEMHGHGVKYDDSRADECIAQIRDIVTKLVTNQLHGVSVIDVGPTPF